MPRLLRPAVPVEIKCRVALRQIGELWPDKVIEEWRPSNRNNKGRNLTLLLARLLGQLSELLGCEPGDLWLDHDPALENRQKVFDRDGRHIEYTPRANDPEHLRYRPQPPNLDGSHFIKTYVRGDNGQLSDAALARKEKKRRKKKAKLERLKAIAGKPVSIFKAATSRPRKMKAPKKKWASRPFPKGRGFSKGKKRR